MFLCRDSGLLLLTPLLWQSRIEEKTIPGCVPSWRLAEVLCAAPGAEPSPRAAVGTRGVLLTPGHGPRAGVWGRLSGPDSRSPGWGVPAVFMSWALLEADTAGRELLLPVWPSRLETLSPGLLSADFSAPSLAARGFGPGKKLLEGFESLLGATVRHSWLWTLGQPGRYPHPAAGCTLPVETLLLCRCGDSYRT